MIFLLRKNILILLLLNCIKLFSQEKVISKIIIDKETKTPIKDASINDGFNYTISNADGFFTLITQKDSIKINLLGYEPFYKRINQVSSNDTILLSPNIISLDEVILENNNKIINDIFKEITNITPNSLYLEKFFLRTTLKKNDSIVKFQDIIGISERKKTFTDKKEAKKNLKIQFLNMRKAGILAKSRKVEDFKFFTSSELFFKMTSIYANPNIHFFENRGYVGNDLQKIYFEPKKPYNNNSFTGYYVFNTKEKNILEANLKNTLKTEYIKKRGFKWRTIDNLLNVKFIYNNRDEKYHISNATISYKVEVITPKQIKNIYKIEYKYFTSEYNLEKIEKNINSNKSIFSINMDYDELFWKNQNHLILDNNLKSFIEKMNNLDEKNKIITNIKN